MSVVAVRKYPKKIIMSADRQTTYGHQKFVESKDALYEEPAKMWKHNDIAVGACGAVQESVLFRIFTKNHKPAGADIEDILEFLVEFSDWAKKKDVRFSLYNHYILIFGGKIFQTMEYEIKEVKEYSSVGSGMFLALGAMYRGAKPQEAIEVAKEFDLYCSGETDVIVVKT